MDNEIYLKQKRAALGAEAYNELLKVLDGYGDDRWWLSDDPRVRAYHQTLDTNGPLILPYKQFMVDLGLLLGREVQLYETRVSNRVVLKAEAGSILSAQEQKSILN
jgi:hypothetical protein